MVAARILHPFTMHRLTGFIATLLLASPLASRTLCAPLVIPFDFSQSELGLKVSIDGKPLSAILDTGVDPSLIDLAEAKALGLDINQRDAGEAAGFGAGRGMTVFPAKIKGLTIGQREFQPFDALASDMRSLTKADQPRLDMVLGYSFLSDKIVLVDYVTGRLAIFDRADEAKAMVETCKARWAIPLTTFESYPLIPDFRFGKVTGPVTLDTGSNGGIGLFRVAETLQGMQASLVHEGSTVHRGARGVSTVEDYSLNEPVGFGPFILPAGQKVFVHNEAGSEKRLANIGNTFLKALKIKMLLDYRSRYMTFFGSCG